MARTLPDSPVHTSFYDPARTYPELASLDVRPGDRLVVAVEARDNDTVGIGYGTVTYASTYPGQTKPTTELNVELFYKARLTKWVSFEPDLQYVLHPGGAPTDALVGGFRFKFKL